MPSKDPKLWVISIPPAVALLASVIAVVVSHNLSVKQQIQQENRKLKTEAYEAFYSAFIAMLTDGPSDTNRKEFSGSYNRVLFLGSDAVVSELVPLYSKMQQNPNMGIGELTGLLDTMRENLGISDNTTLQRVGFIPVGWKGSGHPDTRPPQ